MVLATACRSDPPGGRSFPWFLTADVDSDALVREVTLQGETRRSIAPPTGSRLTYDVTLPDQPVLRFAIGVAAPGMKVLPSRIDFRIRIDGDAVFSETLRRFEPNLWKKHEVDLGSRARQPVRITLETSEDPPERAGSGGVTPVWGHLVLSSRAALADRPPIVLVSIDCLRADHLGAYGYERDTTPNIDALAAKSVLFETAIAPAPETLPSHLSMFTGLAPSFHGGTKWNRLPSSVASLAELLSDNGYATHGIVTGAYLSQSFGMERGFHTYQFRDDPPAIEPIEEAIDLVESLRDQPFFLFVHLFDPHWPYVPPDDFIDKFGPRPADLSGLMDRIADFEKPLASERQRRQVIDLYDAEIAYTDRQVGRLLDAIERAGLDDEAVIIVTGDHGEAFYEHGYWQHTLTLYEEMIRVPLVVRWPDIRKVHRIPQPVSTAELFGTILEAAGIQARPSWARSLRRLVESDPPRRKDDLVISEVSWGSRPPGRLLHKIALRHESWKYVASLTRESGRAPDRALLEREELYNLSSDPGEGHDLLGEKPEIAGDFRRSLETFLREAARRWHEHGPGREVTMDEKIEERLRSLGYLH